MAKHLLIVPTSFLHFWPLWATPVSGRSWLLDHFACAVLPSADALVGLAKQQAAAGDYRGLAPPARPPGPFIIPQIRYEAAVMGGRALVGDEANLETLLAGDDAGVLSLKSHCAISVEQPEESYVQLADRNGGLTNVNAMDFGEALEGRHRAALIAMWACATHGTKIEGGDNWTGLTRALLLGARTLLMTLWPIEDVVALMVAVPFWRAVKAGLTVPQALRCAILAVRDATQAQCEGWARQVMDVLSDDAERNEFQRAWSAWAGQISSDSTVRAFCFPYQQLAPFLALGWPGPISHEV